MSRNKIDFYSNPRDLRVVVLGSLGFSTEYICQQTRMSLGQVIYRLHKSRTRRADYRNGGSVAAGIVLSEAEKLVSQRVRERFKRWAFAKNYGNGRRKIGAA
jgi:hypothetical protein